MKFVQIKASKKSPKKHWAKMARIVKVIYVVQITGEKTKLFLTEKDVNIL